jgi:calcineurin-like phosphoesterase family protein
MKFFTSDFHFNHTNILALCNRPFNDVEEMNETLIKNWNDVVKKNDEVFYLGDWGLGHTVHKDKIKEQLFRLKGTIHFIVGNHDKEILQHCANRFASITHLKTTNIFDNRSKKSVKVVMCHYPMLEWDGAYKGSIHLFGHCHGNLNKMFWKKGTKRHDVGVDVNEFKPLSEDDVLRIVL